MKIGVLGTGTVGRTIATKLVALGHEVTMGSRTADNEQAAEWVAEAGDRAAQGTFADAAAFGEIVFNCTAGVASLEALGSIATDDLAGKILVDVANPLDFSQGMPPTLSVSNTDSLAEQIQRALPDARVVKALNTVNAMVMVDPGRVPGEHDVFLCGNDADAKARVTQLLESFGWPSERVVDLGDISGREGDGDVPAALAPAVRDVRNERRQRPRRARARLVSALPEPTPQTVVMKFGGSSVADPDKIRAVARRLVEAHEAGARVVGTVSAMGHTTDSLLELARGVSPEPNPRELDMLLSTGERIACALVAMAVHDLGHEAVSFTGSQAGIITDPVHTKAKIREITPVRIVAALDEHKIVLVAGFQGFSRDTMDITTLGRGGTDATAVALASALDATCEIYSDVPGVFTADPRIVPEARRLDIVSYEEMLEMAASGAKVLMLRAVEIARARGVPIHARSTFSDEPGTRVQEVAGMEEAIVSAVTQSDDEVVFVLSGVPDRPGSAAAIFDAIADEHANVDTILQNVAHGMVELSLSVPEDDVPATRRALERAQELIGPVHVDEIADLGKVSLVGAGMRSHPGVAARMFQTLADEKVNIRMISTSPIKISCMVSRDEVERAVQALHAAFELERARGEEDR